MPHLHSDGRHRICIVFPVLIQQAALEKMRVLLGCLGAMGALQHFTLDLNPLTTVGI